MAEIREGAEIKPEMDLQELINKDGKGLCALILDPKDRRPGVQPYQEWFRWKAIPLQKILKTTWPRANSSKPSFILPLTARNSALVIQKMPSVGGNVSEISDPDAGGESCSSLTPLLRMSCSTFLRQMFFIASSGRKNSFPSQKPTSLLNATAPATRLTACCCSWASRNAWIF